MIKVDWKTFARHRYWCGYYYVTTCPNHKRFNPHCDWCEQGIWGCTRKFEQATKLVKLTSLFTIGKMPENSLRFASRD